MLYDILQKKFNESTAIEHYEKFLSLWKDADPGIAEVEDARKRLEELNKDYAIYLELRIL